jgi:protein-disulfide isomerase
MNKKTDSPRNIALIAIFGAVLLIGIGIYGFWRSRADTQNLIEQSSKMAAIAADNAVAVAGMSDNQRKATEALVRAYILEHPEIITEAIDILQKRETAERLKSASAQIVKPFPGAEAGNPKGDVTLVEFTDYNCGFCRSSVPDVQRLLKTDGNVRLIYRELPILSDSSREAALWALAAARQGRHKAFHDAMFSGGRSDAQTIRAAARKAGLNLAVAETFAKSEEALAEIRSNLQMMQQIGFSGTPTFIIGDQILEGALGYDALKAAVDKARKER